LREHRIAILGAGGAGSGIASLLKRAMIEDGLSEQEARRQFYLVDRDGLLMEDMTGLLPFQKPFAKSKTELQGWSLEKANAASLSDVIKNAAPTVLIGVSGQFGAFTEEVIRAMAAGVSRPVIFPLSNPTSRAEATPADLMAWTDGRAVVGTGSPFPPVLRNGSFVRVDQTNNSYVFPGIGLAVVAVGARRISDAMLMAAARALSELSPAKLDSKANLLPPVTDARKISAHVALAVATQACKEGLTDPMTEEEIRRRIQAKIWNPVFRPYRRKTP
jgi:malate dehydrogenase (oxaloacetate-decarboxylating)